MEQNKKLAELLLQWFDKSGRDLPWRHKGGAHPNPYVILVSEFMLQQTTVKTVIPYFYRFMQKFPTINDLAAATEEEVYKMWEGLGYYTRARSLHKTAQMIVSEYGGNFPTAKEDVLKLKGIGPYTVASFLALAFNQPETVVDGNVSRIICRMYHLTEPLDKLKITIRELAEKLTNRKRAADYASAIMDLGAVICTPKNPQCLLCPWQEYCQSKSTEELEQIPLKIKTAKPEKQGKVYLIYNDKNEIMIYKKTEKGLLSGLYSFPWSEEELYPEAEDTGLTVTHVFTHFKLTLRIYHLKNLMSIPSGYFYISPQKLSEYPFSILMQKVIRKAIKNPR